ncbi:MAG: MarR family transcriptional regulator [FCB group bacterium]|nr:MarR family transcriptional regulator [FCB group bacterium]MBL7028431.1 MarR family transcriptional regulator [Candidatus Neomarinimicrobiota bacterium]MBL7122345.1 MarR family transcriptional regulator [Candidatus Neomarinimicrobiota bacterium]
MSTKEVGDEKKELFGMIFLLAQRWQYIGDRELKDSGVTTKQWFLLVSLHALFDTPPNLNDLALAMGSTRQNVKQLALNLERQGFLKIYQDKEDRRVQRFKLTPKNQAFWDKRAENDERFIASLFGELPSTAVTITRTTINSLLNLTDKFLK